MPASKRIVFAIWGSLGDFHPYLAIARELQARGHRCVLATNNFYRDRIQSAGFEFAPMGPHITPGDDVTRKIMHLSRGPIILPRELILPYTRQAFVETVTAIKGADLVVTHPITYGAHVAAEKEEIAWASTVLAPMGLFSLREPTLSGHLALLSKLGPIGPILDRLALDLGRSFTRRWTEPVRRLRVELGMPAGAHPIFEGQFSPQLNLALFSPLFGQPQPDWPPHTVVTGFPFYDEPGAMDAQLRKFLTDGEPPLVFTLGSWASAAPQKFFAESLKAIAQLRCRAVVIVGQYGQTDLGKELPPNVFAVPYAPYEQLFPHAAVNVHHGGIGTTAQALRAGRPMLVVPFAFDQPDNAARVKRLGVGRSLPIRQYQVARSVRELKALLQDKSYAVNAAALGDRIRAEDGVREACNGIEKLLDVR